MNWPECPQYTNGRVFLAVVPLNDATFHLVAFGRTWAKKSKVVNCEQFIRKLSPGATHLVIARGRNDRYWGLMASGTVTFCLAQIGGHFDPTKALDLGAVLYGFAHRNDVAPAPRDRRQRKLF